jgi:hypothetical protein
MYTLWDVIDVDMDKSSISILPRQMAWVEDFGVLERGISFRIRLEAMFLHSSHHSHCEVYG